MRALVLLLMVLVGWSHLGICASGAEARISFQVKRGWVAFSLYKEEFPVADAFVQILDQTGAVFAEGTTGLKGQGQFPLPPGEQIQVEVKIGQRSANTIHLTRIGNSVLPNEVLLTYGSKPCCKIDSLSSGLAGSRPDGRGVLDISTGMQLSAGASLILGAGCLAYYLRRQGSRTKPITTSGRRRHG